MDTLLLLTVVCFAGLLCRYTDCNKTFFKSFIELMFYSYLILLLTVVCFAGMPLSCSAVLFILTATGFALTIRKSVTSAL